MVGIDTLKRQHVETSKRQHIETSVRLWGAFSGRLSALNLQRSELPLYITCVVIAPDLQIGSARASAVFRGLLLLQGSRMSPFLSPFSGRSERPFQSSSRTAGGVSSYLTAQPAGRCVYGGGPPGPAPNSVEHGCCMSCQAHRIRPFASLLDSTNERQEHLRRWA